MRKTVFISDLHLSPQYPKLMELFIKFLSQQTKDIDALYILGDLFEAFIGDTADKFNQTVLTHIKAAQLHCPVFFMPGNRDFLLTRNIAAKLNLPWLADPSTINLYGQKTLLMHGDSLCSDDKKYQFARRIMRLRFLQKIFLNLLPLRVRRKIATNMRAKSKIRSKEIVPHYLDTNKDTLLQTMKNYSSNFLIHGHTHKPSIRYFYPEQNRVVVLSDWHHKGNMLTYFENGHFELTYFE